VIKKDGCDFLQRLRLCGGVRVEFIGADSFTVVCVAENPTPG
jgi:hypothetical protein